MGFCFQGYMNADAAYKFHKIRPLNSFSDQIWLIQRYAKLNSTTQSSHAKAYKHMTTRKTLNKLKWILRYVISTKNIDENVSSRLRII